MAKNDFQVLVPAVANVPVTSQYMVVPGTTSSINAGEFALMKGVGNGSSVNGAVKAFTASSATQPAVGTDYVAGFAMSTSTETTTATGFIEVMQFTPGVVYLGNPKTASTWNTQSKYDALVGARVLIDVTAGVHTVLATDSYAVGTTKNGLVVEYIDITQYPGKVAFRLQNNLSPYNQ